ncbi:glutathione S-transferase family protein [Sulfitobacter pontiacus]|uniref:glutathione S-transferase family protein n=1 Tax=Sulfitobacter pontiacus TaxID=60137 RepID=UPI0015DF6668|nr:glutathione S-transferase family protein [Sulfitobacter pontiacus]QLL43813.1 glutathione S-transferase family protein [Sulfitobacter pontiacus]
MTDYTLHYAPDNASLIIRLALEAQGVAYDTCLVDRAAQRQSAPAYRALNPHGLIPALQTPDGPMFETGAILLWLADRHGGLAPAATDATRADFLKWLFFVANTVHPALRMLFYPDKYVGGDDTAQDALHTTVTQALQTHLRRLEDRAAADTLPLALALYLAPLLRWCALYPRNRDRGWFDLRATPHLHALCARVETLPCTAAAQTAEGLGPTPFTAPHLATPPIGSAT